MKPTEKKIKAQLKKLRTICESDLIVESRMAQAMEMAIRWATEETVGWDTPEKECFELSNLLKDELNRLRLFPR